jgi:hypothetical protein
LQSLCAPPYSQLRPPGWHGLLVNLNLADTSKQSDRSSQRAARLSGTTRPAQTRRCHVNNPKMTNGWQGALVVDLVTIGGPATVTARLRRRRDAIFGVVATVGPEWSS